MEDPPPPSYDAVVSGTWNAGSQPLPDGSNPPYPPYPSETPASEPGLPPGGSYPPQNTDLPPKDIYASRASIPSATLTSEAPPDYHGSVVGSRPRSNSVDSRRSYILIDESRRRSVGALPTLEGGVRRSSLDSMRSIGFELAVDPRRSIEDIRRSSLILTSNFDRESLRSIAAASDVSYVVPRRTSTISRMTIGADVTTAANNTKGKCQKLRKFLFDLMSLSLGVF